ncbi:MULTISPECIES: TetR/AcrR family transcriptional regulator [unclassified Nocardioides]|uniref:TetR/AcrR family transcriptional regulator n=1 Tax=unclassified Nocardioides TaxID=2615069 RepID=UPI0026650A58|nr:TetR/AcrR family transcriptional regulator [Nocardioides sp. Arc9.136]WKN48670.1 helix-turn-helix domain containing protein [Nocardioides sp. Arc9.136]
MAGTGVREVARRAVHAEITSAAESLFREQGYDATTVDQIAERVGMSQRTFFRHVGTKEDLVLAEFDRLSARMVEDARSRPETEDPWSSLRHAFEVVVGQREDQAARERATLMMSIVETSGTLRAAYFDRMDLVQRQLVDVLQERAPGAEDRVLMRALVGAAFAALHAVSENCELADGPDTFAADLDRILARLAPTDV